MLGAATIFLFLVVFGFLALPKALGAENAGEGGGITITDVRFEGLKALKAEDLLANIESRPGTKYDKEKLAADLKCLGKSAMDIEARREQTDGGVRLIFIVRENPTLAEVHFVGNSQIKSPDLAKVVRIRPGNVLTRDAVATAREGVLKEYRDRGYMRTQVTANLARTEKGGAVLQVLINEGKKMRVDDLVIHGNAYFHTFRLKAALETKGSWMVFQNYFDESAFENDLQIIRQLYEGAGFFSVAVERGQFRYDEAKQIVTPSIVIVEGPHYRLGNVGIAGNTYFTREEILAPFSGLTGKYFDAKDFAAALEKVRGLYQNAGFVTTEVNYEDVALDRDKGEVNIPVRIEEQGRVRVGRILIQRPNYLGDEEHSWFGKIYNRVAPPISNEAIRREMALKPGEVYDKRKEDESVEKLRRLDVFEEVAIESRSTDTADVRDVLVKIKEGVTGNVLVGVGFSDAYGVYAFGDYTEKNVLGQAGDLRAGLLVGTKVINASISYFDRYLGSSDYSLYSEIHHERAIRPGYDEANTGLSVEVGKPLTDQWKAYVQGRLEYVQLNETGHPKEDFSRNYPVIAARMRFTHDTLEYGDSGTPRFYPTGGHLAAFGFEAGYAGGPLAKLTGSYEWNHKLAEKLVFATALSAGIMPVSADKVGPTERFYLGGTEDLRGFAFRGAGPHDSRDHDVPLGGASKLLARNELRYPIIDNLTGLVFVDAGMLNHEPFSLSQPRASTGVGLRLGVKQVQAGVDLALPVLKGKDDDLRYFHFTLTGFKGF